MDSLTGFVRDPVCVESVLENDLIFHAISWFGKDIENDVGSDDEDTENEKEYQIYVHGVTQNGESVCLRIMNYIYYFYVKIPDRYQGIWSDEQTTLFYKHLKFRLGKKVGVGLVNKTLVNKVDIMGFRNLEQEKFIRLCFKTELAASRCKYLFKKPLKIPSLSHTGIKFVLYESNLDMIVKFTHLRNIRTAGWIRVKKGDFSLENDNISTSQIQATVYWKQVHPYLVKDESLVELIDYQDIAPFRILSWDIETQSSRGFPEFPNAEIKGDFISQIGCCLWIFGKQKIKFILSSVYSDPTEDGIVINCKNEKEMIKTFCDIICNLDPDMLTGYNTWGFDDKYLWKRIEINGLNNYATKLSRIVGVEPTLEVKNLSSGAYGHNEFKILTCPGRETIDLIIAIRREHKLDSYKLGRVGIYFKQGTKVSMIDTIGKDGLLTLGYLESEIDNHNNPDSEKEISEYDVMFRITNDADPCQVKIVCDYCIQDANLVIDLMEKLCIIPNNIEMAKSTRVPISWLLLKGQQCKVFSQLLFETRIRGFVAPLVEHIEGPPPQKFKGATVLTALRGAYFEPVSGLDFKSLYPSIMIAFNMCHSTYVSDPKYLGIDGVEYETIAWHEEAHKDDNTKEWVDAADYSFTFVQNVKGILPDILDRLWKDRNETKKIMKSEIKKCKQKCGDNCGGLCGGSGFKAQVLNGKQAAIKVTMNSIYGFTGVTNHGMLPCKPIAASVTAKGRDMIAHTSQMAQELYSCTTTYGDSVPGYQEVKVNIKGVETNLKIEDLYDKYSKIVPSIDYTNGGRDKKQLMVCEEPIDAWTYNGWKKLRRVIRHKTKSRMYKITTDKGVVFVTGDHSLIDLNGEQIKPTQLRVGTKLSASKPVN
jgi:DNA polymerase delta subunit 1